MSEQFSNKPDETSNAQVTLDPLYHWEYDKDKGHLPEEWGDLNGYTACKIEYGQSPIDIAHTVILSHPLSLTLDYHDSAINLVNTGRTAQVNYAKGSSMTIEGKTYDLVQFHFHDPSEHTFNGVPTAMELHLVHQNTIDKSLAVLGVLLEEGVANPTLAAFWDAIPSTPSTISLAGSINIGDTVPHDSHFFTYFGSLTTPPFTEGVRWFIMRQHMTISKAQLAKFAALFGRNARPVQALGDREIDEE
jgi:carbonic anhydrase